ncbi:MAG: hypothetical protein JWM86_1848 [Thermoleophilia bacterium]|nr:hypothetical protein [Thermoleophilia bacterium]
MELFAPENLPGVGMGDLRSIAAICGLLGMAVTSGMLVAEGAIGTILFIASAVAVLSEKPDLGGSVPAAVSVLLLLFLLTVVRMLLTRGARRDSARIVGEAADSPETRQARTGIARREKRSRQIGFLAVAWAGAASGFAWAEWNEVPFRLEDAEAVVGLAIGVLAAAVGGDAAYRFLQGALRAGGSAVIVGVVVCVAALVLNSMSVYVPFVGAVVFLLVLVLAVRLHRRAQAKFAGLRILS